MTGLRELDLSWNLGLTSLDLNPLSNLTGLRKLLINQNSGLTELDISPLSDLTELQVDVTGSGTCGY